MSSWLIAEIPEIDKISVARVVVGGLKLLDAGITLAEKRLGRYLGILDQQVEAGCYASRCQLGIFIAQVAFLPPERGNSSS
jgi:hypothetical protein